MLCFGAGAPKPEGGAVVSRGAAVARAPPHASESRGAPPRTHFLGRELSSRGTREAALHSAAVEVSPLNLPSVQLPHTQGYVQSATFFALSGTKGRHGMARMGPSVFHTTRN